VANLKGVKKRGLAFWQAAVARVEAGENLAEVAMDVGVARRGLARWQERLDPEMLRTDRRREKALAEKVEELKKALAEKVLEVDFFARCLAQGRGATAAERKRWQAGVYDQIQWSAPQK
jgi:hypothetical protein